MKRLNLRLITAYRTLFEKAGSTRLRRKRSCDVAISAIVELLESRRLLTQSPVIVDNSDAAFSDVRTWQIVSGGGYSGGFATADRSAAGAFASWDFSGLANGQYYLQATWTPGADRATNATFTARPAFDSLPKWTKVVNQQLGPSADYQSGSTAFQTLEVVTVNLGTLTVELTNPGADGLVVADAVRLVPVAAGDNSIDVRTERMKQIALSMHAFEAVYQRFPPYNMANALDAQNNSNLSWRVYLLPYLGYADLFQKFQLDEP